MLTYPEPPTIDPFIVDQINQAVLQVDIMTVFRCCTCTFTVLRIIVCFPYILFLKKNKEQTHCADKSSSTTILSQSPPKRFAI
jgi:hypothetical protein